MHDTLYSAWTIAIQHRSTQCYGFTAQPNQIRDIIKLCDQSEALYFTTKMLQEEQLINDGEVTLFGIAFISIFQTETRLKRTADIVD